MLVDASLLVALWRRQGHPGARYCESHGDGPAAEKRAMNDTDELALAPFDASDYLASTETIAEYLRAARESPDSDAFLSFVVRLVG